MDVQIIIEQATRIANLSDRSTQGIGILSEACEFLRQYAGEKSSFYNNLCKVQQNWAKEYITEYIRSNLLAFARYVENGLLNDVSIERKAQIEVVSDFLSQAQELLETHGVHPAAPAVIIGAALEEFLRTWIEESDVPIGNKKPSIDSYASSLREAELISKQDIKDITSWAGIRNHAAHGEWDEVSDKKRVSLMLEGVNLFMRRYGAE